VSRPPITLRERDVARFLSKLDKNGPIHPHLGTPCWDYVGGSFGDGCGAFKLTIEPFKYRQVRASRIAFIVFHGYDPGDLFVCHKCDRPICCNGEHLFAGTQSDNEMDKQAKGRAPSRRGEDNPVHLLTEAAILDIRRRRAAGEVLSVIAAAHGVAVTTVHAVIKGRSWRHVSCSH